MVSNKFLSLLLLFVFSACIKPAPFLPANQVLSLQAFDIHNNPITAGDSISADNYSYAQIVASVDSSILDTTVTISFTTDNGTFLTGGTSYVAKIDIHGKAYVSIKNKWPLSAHIQASVGSNYTQNLIVPFNSSWPDYIVVKLPASSPDSLKTRLSFSTLLAKSFGTVSPGLTPAFLATDTSGNAKGSFYAVTPSDTTGTVTGQFWLQDSTYVGFLYIRAVLYLNNQHDSVYGLSKLLITK